MKFSHKDKKMQYFRFKVLFYVHKKIMKKLSYSKTKNTLLHKIATLGIKNKVKIRSYKAYFS